MPTISPAALREQTAVKLLDAAPRVTSLSAFLGLDGFVDEIIHVVDKRANAEQFTTIQSIGQLAERIGAAAGKSTNVELVTMRTKLGGNGPIMANALAQLGLRTTYVGAVGHPQRHPVFDEFAKRATVHGICSPGHTNALEFSDGKVMLTKTFYLNDITWQNLDLRWGRENFARRFAGSDLVGFENWTMIPYMSDIWQSILEELCPRLTGPKRKIFFDLADPEKRTASDLRRALQLIGRFEQYFDVVLGLNEKEAWEIGEVLELPTRDRSDAALCTLAQAIQGKLGIHCLVVHPVTWALACSNGVVSSVKGPHIAKPVITTGAGDHFNAGFCLGKLFGFDNEASVLCGVAASGFYVQTGQSPRVEDLAQLLRTWPERIL